MAFPIILDCDPGHDDALAIMLAAADPRLNLLAITTVAGNQTLDKTTLNARRVCTIAGITGVPVAAGYDRPLVGELHVADDIHGSTGLDGPAFGEPTVPLADEHAVALMRRLLLAHPEPVTLVPTGPLTNVAVLLRDHPEVRPKVREIVLMGGSTERGNVTPYAEFNIAVDPEAADLVLRSGLPVTVVGLNVTHQALVTPDVVARFRALGTPLADACVELMTFFASAYERVFGLPDPPLHDPVAIARVIDPSLVECVDVPVVVELTGTHTRGATVVDLHHKTGLAPNARVAVRLRAAPFWDLVVDAVSRLSGSPTAGSPG
ncbi:nucleoside hydrolase [Phytohabitans rumicis]|uniref:Pyrimidine-specific ribonucleoside hydrolase RihA n=1 Tax=Phytohabitans rumicis TaxID=1076125 RepID=A0A6V8L3E5_9ACTN|nr:nucleoside hydrolase [Phytohabitans rumicis]GFJ88607.1 pyrimidine-specific ribonucleoside hydrolase RihA [Phytohabitans rumicis]